MSDELIDAWLDEALDDDGWAALQRWRAADPAHVDRFVRRCHLDRTLAEELGGSRQAAAHRLPTGRSPRRQFRPRRRPVRRRRSSSTVSWGWSISAMAAAAAVLLAVVALIRSGADIDPAGAAPSKTHVRPEPSATESSSTLALEIQAALPPEVRVQVEPGSDLTAIGDGSTLRLEQGAVDCTVAELPSDRNFRVETPVSVVAVHGTAFRVQHREQTTEVAVQVRIDARSGGSPWLLGPGGRLSVAESGTRVLDAVEQWRWRSGQSLRRGIRTDTGWRAERSEKPGATLWLLGTEQDPPRCLSPWMAGWRLRLEVALDQPGHLEVLLQISPDEIPRGSKSNYIQRIDGLPAGRIVIDLPLAEGFRLMEDGTPFTDGWIQAITLLASGADQGLRLHEAVIVEPR